MFFLAAQTFGIVVHCSCFAGPLPQGVEALLVHSDSVQPPPVQLSLTVTCQKVGISLELAADWPARTNSSPDTMFHHLEAAVSHISADIRPTGTSFHASLKQANSTASVDVDDDNSKFCSRYSQAADHLNH